MSFSSDVKKLITTQDFKDANTRLAILSGIIKSCGVLLINNKKISIRIDEGNNNTMRFLFKLIKDLYNLKPQILINESNNFGVNKIYSMYLENMPELLVDCGILNQDFSLILENRIPQKFIREDRYKRAFIKGVFLGCGSVNDPENSYHMEIVLNAKTLADDILGVLSKFNILGKLLFRRDAHVVYFKDSEHILNMLYLLEVSSEAFKFEDVLLLKKFRNEANRMRNCDTGNLNRLLKASYRQIDAINLIIKSGGLEKIPENLREIAMLRLENPEADLNTLGSMMSKPISKSTVNSKLKKLENISKNYS